MDLRDSDIMSDTQEKVKEAFEAGKDKTKEAFEIGKDKAKEAFEAGKAKTKGVAHEADEKVEETGEKIKDASR
jgi:hypothetical protein